MPRHMACTSIKLQKDTSDFSNSSKRVGCILTGTRKKGGRGKEGAVEGWGRKEKEGKEGEEWQRGWGGEGGGSRT